MGAPKMAKERRIICIAAGPQKSIDRIKPYVVGV